MLRPYLDPSMAVVLFFTEPLHLCLAITRDCGVSTGVDQRRGLGHKNKFSSGK